MSSSLPDIVHLKSFDAVVAHKGISGASRATRMPKSTLSRHIVQLEATIGAPLFERSTQEFVLTATGRLVHEQAARVLRSFEGMMTAVSSADPRGLLRISTTYSLFSYALRPVLPVFLDRYPEIDLFIETTAAHRDLFDGSFDLALRGGQLSGDDLIARRLGKVTLGLYAAPGSARPASRTLVGLTQPSVPHDQRCPRLTLVEPATVKEMIVDGYGSAWLPEYLCRADVAAGRLERLAGSDARSGPEIFVLYRRADAQAAKSRAFIDFLAEMLVF